MKPAHAFDRHGHVAECLLDVSLAMTELSILLKPQILQLIERGQFFKARTDAGIAEQSVRRAAVHELERRRRPTNDSLDHCRGLGRGVRTIVEGPKSINKLVAGGLVLVLIFGTQQSVPSLDPIVAPAAGEAQPFHWGLENIGVNGFA